MGTRDREEDQGVASTWSRFPCTKLTGLPGRAGKEDVGRHTAISARVPSDGSLGPAGLSLVTSYGRARPTGNVWSHSRHSASPHPAALRNLVTARNTEAGSAWGTWLLWECHHPKSPLTPLPRETGSCKGPRAPHFHFPSPTREADSLDGTCWELLQPVIAFECDHPMSQPWGGAASTPVSVKALKHTSLALPGASVQGSVYKGS